MREIRFEIEWGREERNERGLLIRGGGSENFSPKP